MCCETRIAVESRRDACVSQEAEKESRAFRSGRAGDALVQRHLEAGGDGVLEPQGENTFQHLCLLIPEHNRENVVIDQLLDALSDTPQEFFPVQNGCQLMADLIEKTQRLGLLGLRHIEAGRHGIRVTKQ